MRTTGSESENVLHQPAQTIPIDWDGDGLQDLRELIRPLEIRRVAAAVDVGQA